MSQVSQIFLNIEGLSQELIYFTQKIKYNFRNFNHVIYDSFTLREFIKENYDSDVLWAYDELIPFSYKADLGRLCILNTIGGWYFDISINIHSFLNIEGDIDFMGFRDNAGTCFCCILYSKPNNPGLQTAIKQIVENCRTRFYGMTTLCPTGPNLLGKALASHGANEKFLYGDVIFLKNDYDRKNRAFVCPDGTILGFSKEKTLLELGVKNYKSYDTQWKNRKIYKTQLKIGIILVLTGNNYIKMLDSLKNSCLNDKDNGLDVCMLIIDNGTTYLHLLNDFSLDGVKFMRKIRQEQTLHPNISVLHCWKILFDIGCDLFLNMNDNTNVDVESDFLKVMVEYYVNYKPQIISGYNSDIIPSCNIPNLSHFCLKVYNGDANYMFDRNTFEYRISDVIKPIINNNINLDYLFYNICTKIGFHVLKSPVIYDSVKSTPNEKVVVETIPLGKEIPKKIYMCYKTKNIPKKVIENWKKLNPDYEICLYDDEECYTYILENYNKEYADLFNEIPSGPIKADFWRVCILYKNGGIYTDIDLVPLQPLSSFITDDVKFSSILGLDKINIFQAFILSTSGNPILKSCIEMMLNLRKTNFMYAVWAGMYHMYFTMINMYDNVVLGKTEDRLILEEFSNEEKPTQQSIYVRHDNKTIFKSRYDDYNETDHKFE